jgi:hypothetical protein
MRSSYKIRGASPELRSSQLKKLAYLFGEPLTSCGLPEVAAGSLISGSSPLPCSTSSGAFLQSAVVTDFTRGKKFLTAPTVTQTESNR